MSVRFSEFAAMMTSRTRLLCLVLLLVTTAGCDRLKPKKAAVQRKKAVAAASASASASAVPSSSAPTHPHPLAPLASSRHLPKGPGDDSGSGFALPFAWETSEHDPLARTRQFLRETLRDNREYMNHGPKFFETFANSQKPRATVIACADSRVQSAAWDLTPENDDFTVRNIGNQVATSLGSVEYGVEHLSTPVLLIVGHTGCGAVKAAMGDKRQLSGEIRKEIDPLIVPKELEGQTSDAAWTDAVIANVHAQVGAALSRFAPLVHEGRLTVVGVVYDFRNDLGKGSGKLEIVSVNGNSEEQRLTAFVGAVMATGSGPLVLEPPAPKGPAEPSNVGTVEQVTKQLEGLLQQPGKASTSPH